MGLIAWLVLGALAGWIASIILRTNDEQGAIGNIVAGIVGALLGGSIAEVLLGSEGVTGFNLSSVIIAIGGAVLFLMLKGAVTGRRSV